MSARKERLLDAFLPSLRPDLSKPPPARLAGLFDAPVKDVWLEIGFGSGEHLLWQAERNPETGFIGCEPFINGVATLLGGIEDRGLRTVLVHDGDARDILGWLPEGSIGRVFLLFPDPWPKKRQMKRRLLGPEFLNDVARVIRQGGEFRFASDDTDYAEQARLLLSQDDSFSPAGAWRQRPADWPETRYERKALSEGRKPVYLSFERR